MLIGSIPVKFNIPFAASAGAGFVRQVPQASQISITPGAASLTDGFPPDCFLPIGTGGVPPFGRDVNGILKQITQWNQWQQAGGPISYDSVFQAAVGGYPLGALVPSAVTFGLYWYSIFDANTSNPDTGGAGWLPVPLGLGGVMTTGDLKFRAAEDTIPGFVKANGTTIGNTGSAATQLVSPSAFPLFSWLWTHFTDTLCPVSGGRGANPTADFAALKTIAVLPLQGTAILGMDTMGGSPTTILSGVPASSGSPTQSGSFLGEIFHALITAELAVHGHGVSDPTHNHGVNDPTHTHPFSSAQTVGITTPTFSVAGGVGFGAVSASISAAATGISIQFAGTGVSVQNTGSDAGHNTVHRSILGTWYLKI